jgi:hypothetical protein
VGNKVGDIFIFLCVTNRVCFVTVRWDREVRTEPEREVGRRRRRRRRRIYSYSMIL